MHLEVILILLVGFVVLLGLGAPIGMSLLVAGSAGFIVSYGEITAWFELISMPLKLTSSLQNFLLLSIPMFILAAKIMNGSSITHRIFHFANTAVGWLPGGLGHANIVASLIFAGMSGTAVSDAAGLGQIEIEAMSSNGFDKEFSAGVTAASSTIAPIFPPSVPMVMYATVSGASVGALFMGGVLPGLIMTLSMMAIVYVVAKKRNYPRMPFPSFKVFVKAAWEALIPMMTPVILLVGIWSGKFTATEAAAVATIYALAVSFLVFKEMTLKKLWSILKEVARDTANTAFVVAAAAFYGWVLTRCGVTNAIANCNLERSLLMNVDMKEQVVKLLEGYTERERQIALLHYEMQHTASISPEEVIGSMSLGHSDDIGGGSSRGHISNKTAYIALNYQERIDHLKTESLTEIAECLMELEAVQDRLRYYVTLLEKREAEVIRLFYFEGHTKQYGFMIKNCFTLCLPA